MELLAESGYAGMTLAAVGDRAGYSRGLVTARFGNKQNLLRALTDRLNEGWRVVSDDETPTGDGLSGVVTIVRRMGDQVSSDPVALRALQRLIFERAVGPTDDLRRDFDLSSAQIERKVEAAIARGIADGSVRADVVPDRAAALVIASLRGISYQWFLHPADVDVVELHADLADQLARSLAP